VTLHVRSSFVENDGTIVYNPSEGETVEEPIITGVAGDLSEAKITVVGVPDVPGKAAQIFTVVAEAQINIDMIVQNVSAAGQTDISLTLPKAEAPAAIAALKSAQSDIGFADVVVDENIGKLSVVGAGMRTSSGVSAQLFTALFEAGVNIDMISTSEIRISVIMRADQLNDALRKVHTAFGLDSDVEAVVYAGTGR
jgi:aspartate kinase